MKRDVILLREAGAAARRYLEPDRATAVFAVRMRCIKHALS
ncbi:hypothetical protein ADILRU_1676 [Leifsonia rubra CMS 76R]|nr:hypothetical protein ADILRU_1676 [Leifsonia rubra CMS 76R]